jgi:hypothetical protein
MKTKSLLLTAAIGAGLACGLAAQVREQPGEMVQMKSLSASVQQTISQKAGWRTDRSGEKGRRREWQMELRSRRQIAGERMGIRSRPERKTPQDARREKITENCKAVT